MDRSPPQGCRKAPSPVAADDLRSGMTAPLVVFPFRYKDTRTDRWVQARYMATREEIAAR